MITLVTGFFDIKRESWEHFSRKKETYLENAKRVLSIPENMVIFVEKDLAEFVEKERSKFSSRTRIMVMTLEQLPWYPAKDKIESITKNPTFRKELQNPTCPEVNISSYNILMWSKIALLSGVILKNPFSTKYFGWIDFGLHTNILTDEILERVKRDGTLFPYGIYDNIHFHSRFYPSFSNLRTFLTSNISGHGIMAGGFFTGSGENLQKMETYFRQEVINAISNNLVEADQAFYYLVFRKHPDMFVLSFGDWNTLIDNYYYVRNDMGYIDNLLVYEEKCNPEIAKRIITFILEGNGRYLK